MRILLTGSEGYIGTVLGPYLMDRGHEVVGIDSGFHRVGWLYNGVERSPAWVNRDVRSISLTTSQGSTPSSTLASCPTIRSARSIRR